MRLVSQIASRSPVATSRSRGPSLRPAPIGWLARSQPLVSPRVPSSPLAYRTPLGSSRHVLPRGNLVPRLSQLATACPTASARPLSSWPSRRLSSAHCPRPTPIVRSCPLAMRPIHRSMIRSSKTSSPSVGRLQHRAAQPVGQSSSWRQTRASPTPKHPAWASVAMAWRSSPDRCITTLHSALRQVRSCTATTW